MLQKENIYMNNHTKDIICEKKRFHKIISLCFDFQDIIDQKIFMKNYMNN